MRNKLIIALSLIIATLSVVGWANQVPRTQWEYKFVYQCDEKKTNNLAAEGWELSDMSMASYGSIGVATCVFKRLK